MLELSKILSDIDKFGKERASSLKDIAAELSAAEGAMALICGSPDDARSRIAAARTSWLTSDFVESPDKVYDLPQTPASHAVVAVDGSQICADKHEVALCYLLNAASITLHYGSGKRPVAKIEPRLCYQDEDLFEDYNGRRVPVNEKSLGVRRTLAESVQLECALKETGTDVPVAALWDGSLIRWSLENEPPEYKKRVLNEYLRAFDQAKEMGIPIAGYISDPGSRDFVNSMRIMLCDQTPVDCDKCPYEDVQSRPCERVGRLRDSSVYRQRLAGGKRSVLFTSKSRILKDYREHDIWAFYMDCGREIVRVEVPEWVASDRQLLDLVHAVCHDQAQKGRGYPVALAEAHEHAVIRGPERSAFFQAIERSFIKHGAKITRSMKRVSKGY